MRMDEEEKEADEVQEKEEEDEEEEEEETISCDATPWLPQRGGCTMLV